MSLGVGLTCFLRGARLARARSLRPFVWAPFAVSFAVIAALTWLGFAAFEDARAWFASLLPGWLGWLDDFLAPVVYLLGAVVAIWLYGLLAVFVASPLLGALSARAEREAFGTGPGGDATVDLSIARTLAREGRKVAYHLPRLSGLFLLTLVPVVNAAAPILWFVFGAWMLAVQFADYAAENRGLAFPDTVALLRANRLAALGLGAPVALLLAVPFAAVVVIPAAVCGGALLWRRLA